MQKMGRVVDFIEKNLSLIEKLLKIGRVPLSLMNDYQIYKEYDLINNETSKMEKYMILSKKLKCSTHTVRRAVFSMEKKFDFNE